jgi:mRNA interferase MazF
VLGGHRPVVVVAGEGYLDAVTTLALIVPVTTVDRGWPNHIQLTGTVGLESPSWAMTEQIRTISRTRLTQISGRVSTGCLREIRTWLADFLELPAG